MSFLSDIYNKAKDLLQSLGREEKIILPPEEDMELDEAPVEIVTAPVEVLPPEGSNEETDAEKILADFTIKHPAACEIFKEDIQNITEHRDDLDFIRAYGKKCDFKLELYANYINDVVEIGYVRTHVIARLKPEVIFEVQETVKENIELVKDLIPYVIRLFIYDCKILVTKLCKFFLVDDKQKDLKVKRKSIADDFVKKISAGITSHIKEMLVEDFAKKELEVASPGYIAALVNKYDELMHRTGKLSYTAEHIINPDFEEKLSEQIDKVISRYENRHLVDKIKDYGLILWYVLRFFYSLFFGAGFLYLLWLGKNLDKLGEGIDQFIRNLDAVLEHEGGMPSDLIAPVFAAALSKITILLVILGILSVFVYFAYRVYTVRNKLSDIVSLNISMYAASLLEISILQSTSKLIYDLGMEVQQLLEMPQHKNLVKKNAGSKSKRELWPEASLEDAKIVNHIERVREMKTLSERLIACLAKQSKMN